MFEKNVGTIDRYIRFALGIVLLISGIYFITGDNTALGIGLAVFSLIPLATAAMSSCPLYSLLGIQPCSASKAKAN